MRVITAPLWMAVVNRVAGQDHEMPASGMENVRLAESSTPTVPMGDQLAAGAIDGIAHAPSTSTAPKSNPLFFNI